MPNFRSLARLEVPEKIVWGGVGGMGGGLKSHFHVKPNSFVALRLGLGLYIYMKCLLIKNMW